MTTTRLDSNLFFQIQSPPRLSDFRTRVLLSFAVKIKHFEIFGYAVADRSPKGGAGQEKERRLVIKKTEAFDRLDDVAVALPSFSTILRFASLKLSPVTSIQLTGRSGRMDLQPPLSRVGRGTEGPGEEGERRQQDSAEDLM